MESKSSGLVTRYPVLNQADPNRDIPVMMLSGTSVAAPVVAGAAVLMIQKNPGLTPPLVKAILQYTAQQLPNANVAE